MRVPFLDLRAQYSAIRDEVDSAINSVIGSCKFVGGPEIAAFEEEFARFCGVQHAVGCANGTAALHLALLVLGIDRDDEVITVANTFAATAEAIIHAGAVPVFVDVDERTRNMDLLAMEEAITAKTRAIIPVHLHGQCADMDPILAIARKHGVSVIEDAAQAHGATCRGRRAGSLADVACFSFYPGKNLGAYGDAGMLTTSDRELAMRLAMLANHGRSGKYEHAIVGYNYRLDTLQAAILRVKLRHLDEWTASRRQVAAWYGECLRDEPQVRMQDQMSYAEHVYHHLVVRVADRDSVQRRLIERGVPTVIHYPIPLHKQPAFSRRCRISGTLDVTEQLAQDILSLPIFPEMTRDQVRYVVEQLKLSIEG